MTRQLVASLLALTLGFASPAMAQAASGEEPGLSALLGQGSGILAKGKQPASGLVVNVPSGKARMGLLTPEATFVGESEAVTRNRHVAGLPAFYTTSMGTHVANAAASNSMAPPVSLVCTAQDKNDKVRVDLPKGFDLGLLTLVMQDEQPLPMLIDAQAFYLDVAKILELAKYGLDRIEMVFYDRTTLKSFRLVFRLQAAQKNGLLQF